MRGTLAVFLLALALYLATASGWPWRAPDEFEVYFQTESLVTHGTLALEQPELGGNFFGKRGLDGKRWAPYGPLVAFVLAPFHAVARAVTQDPYARGGLTSLAAAFGGALAVAGFFRAALARTKLDDALLLSLALATSVLWPYSKTLFSEAFSAAALTWAWVFISEKRLAPAAFLLAAACLLKATNAVFALPLALLCDGRRVLVWGVVAALLVHMQWNAHRFGDFRQLGYDWSETVKGEPRPFGGSLLRGLAVLVLSPGKSLFVWAPCLLLALPHLAKDREIAITGAVGLVVFSVYMFPEGGFCHGPRHLVPIVPLLLLAATRGFSRRRGDHGGPEGAAPRESRRALIATVILGASMNLIASSVSYLEDQATDGFTRFNYYAMDPTVPDGLPRNVYRLGYLPQVSLVKTLVASSGASGTGLDFFFRHVRRPIGFAPLVLGGVSLLAGVLLLRKTLLRKEFAAILPERSP